MGLVDRVYNIARGHLDKAMEHWEQIDSRAQQELDQYIDGSDKSAWDRAKAKIAALDASRELSDSQSAPQAQQPRQVGQPPLQPAGQTAAGYMSATTVHAAYKILGLPPGADFASVRAAYHKLVSRAAPHRFPEGSAEQAEAQRIERRAGAAYMMLTEALSPADDRFDRLEI